MMGFCVEDVLLPEKNPFFTTIGPGKNALSKRPWVIFISSMIFVTVKIFQNKWLTA